MTKIFDLILDVLMWYKRIKSSGSNMPKNLGYKLAFQMRLKF